jgi:hypothetical protein
MAWKKIILSGSQAELANLVVDSNVTASAFSGDGSGLTFQGTGIASSSAQVVSYVDSQDVNLGGISGSSLDVTGGTNLNTLDVSGNSSFAGISGSSLDITGNAKIDGNLVLGGNITIGDQSTDNILFGGEVSSSILPKVDNAFDLGSNSNKWNTLHVTTISGSFISASAFQGDGSNLTNITVSQAATVTSTFTSQTSVAVSHNFDSKNVNVAVYDSNDTQIIPASVTLTDLDTVTVTFDSATSGFVVVAKGGHIVSGSIDASNISGFDAAVVSALPAGTVSGSVQVDLTATTNYVSGIKDRLDAEGVISGSVQVDITQTTGYTDFSSSIAADIAGISTDFADITNKPTLVSSSIAGDAQGQIKVNGVNVNVTDLQTSSSPTFASLTLTGDLFVQGSTTSIETTNLLVEDRFILLNSGSVNPDQGGLVIDEGNGQGHAFLYDNVSTRFGFTGSLASDATSATPDAFVGAVIDIDAGHADVAEYQKNGNIKVDSGTIYIYA